MKKLFIMLVLVIVASLTIITSCGEPSETPQVTSPSTSPIATETTAEPTAAPTTDAKVGGVLINISNESPVGTLGVPCKFRGVASGLVRPIFETLLYSDPQGNWHPLLATEFEWNQDHTSINFTLRQGVKFHDGTDFDAEAVKWNIEDRVNGQAGGMVVVKSVDVLDKYAVRVNFTKYDMMWLLRFEKGMGVGYMISPTSYENNGEEYTNWHPVGTGPYKFKDFKADEYLEMERNEDYWGGRTNLDGIKDVFIADPVTAKLAFQSEDGHTYRLVNRPNEVAAELAPLGYEIFRGNGGLVTTLVPDSIHPDSIFANTKIREAVEYAIDKKKIVDNIGHGYWELNYQCGVWGDLGPSYQRQYDPDKAKQLLEEAGYPDGFSTTLYCGTHFNGEHIAAVQDYLKVAGINAELELMTPAKWLEMELGPVEGSWTDGLMVSVVEPGDNLFAYADYSFVNFPSNVGRYKVMAVPDGLKELQTQFFSSLNPDEQKTIVQKMEKIIWDNCMMIPLWTGYNLSALQPTLHDMYDANKYRIDSQWDFTGCWIDK